MTKDPGFSKARLSRIGRMIFGISRCYIIHRLNPDYSFHLRPHLLEGWDLVCYAIPSNRRL
jgi:hypothetical protein